MSETEITNFVTQNSSIIKDSVLPAYTLLFTELSDILKSCSKVNENGLSYLPNGRDYYAYLVKSYTGSDRSIPELKAMIQNKLSVDMTAMADILTKNPDLQSDFYNIPTSNTSKPEDILNELIKKISSDFPECATTDFQVKDVASCLENHLSPAFYFSPPIDAMNDNVIYINNSPKFKNQDLYTTLAHEGFPGHLYQSTYFANTNPSLIRHVLNFGGYTEGWATYVEFLSYYYDTNNKKLADVLSYSASFSLALYSIVDIGVNYEKWTLKDTAEFLNGCGFDDENAAQEIFNAVVCDPANYLQYYVGYLEILDLKSLAQNSKGEDFNLKAFHKFILDFGPAPFSVIKKWMDVLY